MNIQTVVGGRDGGWIWPCRSPFTIVRRTEPVLGGAFAPRMPEVELDDASAEALYAYLVNTTWHAYDNANASATPQ